jgi:F0F1-type ATP synthase membrane subunit c/vacuolar-type H+-ATPase subunit K
MDYEDPGWRPALRRSALIHIPIVGLVLLRRSGGISGNGITALRAVYVGLVNAVWLMGFVLLFIVPRRQWFDLGRTNSFFWVVLGVGVTSVSYVQVIRGRPLNTSSPTALSASYRTQLFIGLGVSEAAALAGFVGSFLMGTWWIYLLGAILATIGFILIGPSRREIARRQEGIAAQGSSLSLGKALVEAPLQR